MHPRPIPMLLESGEDFAFEDFVLDDLALDIPRFVFNNCQETLRHLENPNNNDLFEEVTLIVPPAFDPEELIAFFNNPLSLTVDVVDFTVALVFDHDLRRILHALQSHVEHLPEMTHMLNLRLSFRNADYLSNELKQEINDLLETMRDQRTNRLLNTADDEIRELEDFRIEPAGIQDFGLFAPAAPLLPIQVADELVDEFMRREGLGHWAREE